MKRLGWRTPMLALAPALALVAGLGTLALVGCGNGGRPQVVLFCAQDRIYADPVIKRFEERTGIQVLVQTDAEASKTVGLVTRLIARKARPECDVFWNNELAQALVLKSEGILEAYASPSAEGLPERQRDAEHYWTGFAARARVILYNTELVKPGDEPKSIWDLADPRFKDKVAIARPLWGTTFTHAAALFQALGPEKAKEFFQKLKANGVKVAPGNAMARNMVADGEAAVCLTDTDDAHGAYMNKRPVKVVFPDQDGIGTLVIPNTVMLIKGGPNTENGKKLIDFLLTAEVEALLAQSESAQMPLRPGVPGPPEPFGLEKVKRMDVDWPGLAQRFPEVKAFIEPEFVK